ncbi:alpha/beta hydrolase family protein [Paenibacillus peoriae]|uniref:alpha/beta hydrolase family protein n=1 Tax=Paenibacillus peoriae TaxID=59893 RepID=UPI00096D1431|nr:prolyl oligopeptidase family serine peptidase [Paenibacillus peoriae]OMF40389.1 lipase [Paenibacillus peoriae]
MRTIEIALLLVSLAAAGVMIFEKKERRLDIAILSSLVFVVLLLGTMDHFRMQMLPTYLVALILSIGFMLRMIKPQSKVRLQTRFKKYVEKGLLAMVVMALTAGSMILTHVLPTFSLPEPTGKYAIGTISRHLTDPSRDEILSEAPGDKRELMVNVWYPVDPDVAKQKPKESYPAELGEAISLVFGIPKQLFSYLTKIPTHVVQGAEISTTEAKYPVLLFSPGVRSTRFQSMTAVEELVSHGYIVVGMDHPYSSANVSFPDGRNISYTPEPEFTTSAELYENNVKGVGIRAADSRFVLDTLTRWNTQDPNQLFEGRLDLEHVGIFGHSYGGATTAETLAQDKRFKAGVSLEGGFWGTVAHSGLQQPFMYMMTGTTAESLKPSVTQKDKVFYSEFAPDLNAVMTKSQNDTYYLTVDQFFHQSFTDLALISPSLFAKHIDPVHNIDITRSYVRAFFDQYIKGKQQTLLNGPSPEYPEVSFDPNYTKRK